ncbi:Aspartate-semialdehyde dehydrogenase [hydrothermal vent metagenome]|uniref:Aspartate-semialdehyde dehydrogenase n=1 Tax=hydrothermal vent metagenome TaxID=652676 RepID=A0A3B0ZL46_9ZZZZ
MTGKNDDATVNIAVVGATGLVGSAVLEHLSDSEIPTGQVYALASDNSEAEFVDFSKRSLSVHPVSEFDFKQVQLCFFCVPAEVAAEYLPAATKAGCYCIDFSTCSRLDDKVPLIVSGVNEKDLQELDGRIVASPDSSIVHLAQILAPLKELGVIERVNATMMRAVSEMGRKGIDELSQQSIALFNLKPIKHEHFLAQIAFNVLPHVCHAQANNQLIDDLQSELAKVMHDAALLLNTSLISAPVFYGHSMMLQLEFSQDVDVARVTHLLATDSDLHCTNKQINRPDSVSDAVNQKGVYLGCVRQDTTWQNGINLWAVADNIHQGAAINGVQIGEILVKSYL